jgi:apolipoprotein N-acyltransferase
MRVFSTTQALVLALASGCLYICAHPPVNAGSPAYVALVPLILAAHGVRPIAGFMLGWLAGTIACNGLTSGSIFVALVRAQHPSWLAAGEAFVVPQLCGALYFALFGAYVSALARRRLGASVWTFAVAAGWVATEVARSRIGHGMPWVLLAHSQVGVPIVLQVADLAGAPGVSFLVALVNATVAAALREGRGAARPWRAVALSAGVVASALVYGSVQLGRWSVPRGAPLDVALVQGAIPPGWRTTLSRLPDVLVRYRRLVEEAAGEQPDLIVLPENAASVSAATNPRLAGELSGALAGTDGLLVFGTPRTVTITPDRASVRNAAYLVDAEARILAVYDKRHLVPFGETSTWLIPAPLARRLRLEANYSAGTEPTLFAVHGHAFATFICWEGIYASTVADSVRAGATFLVNLSNDDWFGGRAAREQHLRATWLRAVETRRSLVRATNSGVTTVVDPRGIPIVTAARDRPVFVAARVTAETGLTPYARFGDLFGWLCVGVAVAAVLRRSDERRTS